MPLRLLRRAALAVVGAALFASGPDVLHAQGRCMRTPDTPACNTNAIPPVFASTGWKTVALDHLTLSVPDYKKEAAFYVALMGWTLRSDDGSQAVLDVGDWGTVVLKSTTAARLVVDSFCFVITPWNAEKVAAELRTRGLTPVADNDGHGFESFHVKDPDGFDLQISNDQGHAKRRRQSAAAPVDAGAPAPFEATGWKTVWLDHLSFSVTNYKQSTSFYTNLLGWKETYDEGSQNECLIGEVGDIIIRGGNPLAPNFGQGGRGGRGAATTDTPPARSARIDHISFGIQPWDTDGVKAALEQRGLRARVDTSTGDEIHVAAFKSYHTTTPNGYDLQISAVTHDTRLTLSNAVRPR